MVEGVGDGVPHLGPHPKHLEQPSDVLTLDTPVQHLEGRRDDVTLHFSFVFFNGKFRLLKLKDLIRTYLSHFFNIITSSFDVALILVLCPYMGMSIFSV